MIESLKEKYKSYEEESNIHYILMWSTIAIFDLCAICSMYTQDHSHTWMVHFTLSLCFKDISLQTVHDTIVNRNSINSYYDEQLNYEPLPFGQWWRYECIWWYGQAHAIFFIPFDDAESMIVHNVNHHLRRTRHKQTNKQTYRKERNKGKKSMSKAT